MFGDDPNPKKVPFEIVRREWHFDGMVCVAILRFLDSGLYVITTGWDKRALKNGHAPFVIAWTSKKTLEEAEERFNNMTIEVDAAMQTLTWRPETANGSYRR